MITKQITINYKDFKQIEKVFFNHLKKNPEDKKALKTFQSIINQSLD